MMNAKKHAILLKVASVDALMHEALPRPGDRILIINSATGDLAKALLDKYTTTIDIVCTETVSHLLESTREKTRSYPNIKMQTSKLTQLPFPEGSFDLIISASDIEFVKHRDTFMKRLRSLLKPDGSLFLTSYHPVGIWAWFKEFDWKVFDKHYHGRVNRNHILKLFRDADLKLIRTKKVPVLGRQEVLIFKGVPQ